MRVRSARGPAWWAGMIVVGGSLVGACGEEAPERRPRRETHPPTPEVPSAPSGAGTEAHAAGDAHARTEGSFYSLALPEGAARAETTSTDIIDAVYVLSPEEHVSLTVFRPMPAQHDLEAWTDAAERILDGMASRHDDARLGDVDARLAVFPGELRWTAVADGRGLLVKCFAEEPEDEAWMHARCDDVIASLRLSHPVQ